MRIGVLGIGTELTTGQILNRNASWISAKMKALGVPTIAHVTVPDDRPAILLALQYLASQSDILFITGGLGPTSDDFTREVVNDWCGSELVFDDASWDHIQKRLTSRGATPKDVQRQQAYFPKGAKILTNSNGTAHGFFLKKDQLDILVLPGPPKEIEAIWKDHIESYLGQKLAHIDPLITESWDTLGFGESDVAQIADEALAGSGLEVGYRVHHPYVEVKVTYPKSQTANAQKTISALNHSLNPMTVLRNGQNPAQVLSEIIERKKTTIIYESGSTWITQRLFEATKNLKQGNKIQYINNGPRPKTDFDSLLISFENISPIEAKATWTHKGQTRSQLFHSPYHLPTMRDRSQQYLAEMALIFWMRDLQVAD